MGTCKTCKYFGRRFDHYGQSECLNEKTFSLAQDGIFPNTDSNVKITICVGPNFGCIHHEEKK